MLKITIFLVLNLHIDCFNPDFFELVVLYHYNTVWDEKMDW